MPGLPTVTNSSQAWASVGSMWSTSLNEGWLPEWKVGSTGGFTVPCSPSSSGYIFTSTGDGTTGSGNGFYALGRAVRIVQGASTIYGNVATASVAAGVTTVGLSSTLASAALSTATAFTSVATGTEMGHSLSGSSGLDSALVHRGDGTWGSATSVHGSTSHTDRTREIFLDAQRLTVETGGSATLNTTAGANNIQRIAWTLDDTTVENVLGQFIVPSDWTSGAITFKWWFFMYSATSGNVVIRTRAISTADGASVDIASELDASDTVAVPGTAELIKVHTASATLTVSAGDLVIVFLTRTASDGSDTATGDLGLLGIEAEYTAEQ